MKIVIVVSIMLLTMVAVYATTEKQFEADQSLIPDSKLPWGQSPANLTAALNEIYPTKETIKLCQSDENSLYMAMCIVDKDGRTHKSHLSFLFQEGKLTGYMANFKLKELDNLVKSANYFYGDGARGKVSGDTRTFYIFEKDFIESGTTELYIASDKVYEMVRVQVRFVEYSK